MKNDKTLLLALQDLSLNILKNLTDKATHSLDILLLNLRVNKFLNNKGISQTQNLK